MHTLAASLALALLALAPLPVLAQDSPSLAGGVELAFEGRHDGRLGTYDFGAAVARRGDRLVVTRTSGSNVTTSILDVETGAELGAVAGSGPVSAYEATVLEARTTRDGTATFSMHPSSNDAFVVRRHDLGATRESWAVTWKDPNGAAVGLPRFDAAADGSRVFVGAGNGPLLVDSVVVALDGATGAVLWERSSAAAGVAAVRASADGSTVYVSRDDFATGFNVATALDGATGAELWTTSAAGAAAADPAAEAVVFEGLLGSQLETGLVAYAAGTGTLLWTAPLPDYGRPPVESADRQRLYTLRGGFPSGPQALHAVDAATGAVLWQAPLASFASALELSHDQRTLLVAGGVGGAPGQPAEIRLVAFDPDTGHELYEHALPEPSPGFVSALAFGRGSTEAFVLANQSPPGTTSYATLADAELAAVELASGAAAWRTVLDTLVPGADLPRGVAVHPGGRAFYVASGLAPSPVLTTTMITPYVGPDGGIVSKLSSPSWGEVVAFDAATGTERWAARRRREAPFAGGSWGDDLVEVSPDGELVLAAIRDGADLVVAAYDAAGGREVWSAKLPTGLLQAELDGQLLPSRDGGLVLVAYPRAGGATFEDVVVALDAASGALVWEATASGDFDPARLTEAPDGVAVYAAGSDAAGAVTRAFDAATGAPLWTASGPALDPPALGQGSAAAAAVAGADAVHVTGWSVGSAPDFAVSLWTVAYDPATGAELWSSAAGGGPGTRGEAVALGVAGTVLVGGPTVGGDLRLVAYAARSGALLWSDTVGGGEVAALEGFELDADGTTLFATVSTVAGATLGGFPTFAFDAETGERLWQVGFAGEHGGDAATAAAFDPVHRRLLVAGRTDDLGGKSDTVVLGYDVPTLVSDTGAISASAGGTLGLRLRAGERFAGAAHLVLGTTAGTVPGVELGGALVPLNPSAYLTATLLHPFDPPLSGAVGTLDALGRSSAELVIPPGAAGELVGRTLHHAYVLVDGAEGDPRVSFVSNAVGLELTR